MKILITKKHIQIYKSFDGDIDGWARMKKTGDTMTDSIWREIESILQDISLVKNGLASESFATKALQHLETVCEAPDVLQELIRYSERK